jgi:hypothetical protein
MIRVGLRSRNAASASPRPEGLGRHPTSRTKTPCWSRITSISTARPSHYEAFPAAEARRLVDRFEWHYTPKHRSWLDLAEFELGVLSAQCLDRRIPDMQAIIDEIATWELVRNAYHTKADWHFTTKDVQIKLKYLYPCI